MSAVTVFIHVTAVFITVATVSIHIVTVSSLIAPVFVGVESNWKNHKAYQMWST